MQYALLVYSDPNYLEEQPRERLEAVSQEVESSISGRLQQSMTRSRSPHLKARGRSPATCRYLVPMRECLSNTSYGK